MTFFRKLNDRRRAAQEKLPKYMYEMKMRMKHSGKLKETYLIAQGDIAAKRQSNGLCRIFQADFVSLKRRTEFREVERRNAKSE